MLQVDELREQLGLGEWVEAFSPSRNISPGQFVPVVTDAVSRKVSLYKWGLIPGWAKDPKIAYRMFNARAETLIEKPSFKIPFLRRRCLIPADGFYEWKVIDGKKQPFLFTLKDKKAFTFAGLWEIWRDNDGHDLYSCTIITTEPNSVVAQYHDRMPVILNDEHRWQWLEASQPAQLQALLKPVDGELMAAPLRVDPLIDLKTDQKTESNLKKR
ncbi:MAG TPA: SOS response-associated peptidase [Anaerolineaceae bacterium]|jgi:putative SOS response-associated peptidase YedK|nr:SOS response-associated peptidase [Anaerolineaceae bacterium]NMC17737.1 SOS response-associated peptidase [Chloroflexota bacterium]HNW13986.1 SOS response-associated peptidase [Anaerolineaceae bacterium]HOE03289.1 SOS response-associated peptidase [Anaerolineaceae bacterium]HPD63249.1 SOS response-associated peptidase [Anaerolineaceae bacterium]